MQLLAIAFVIFAGVLNAVQAGANAQLGRSLGQPLWAAIFVYTSVLVALLLALLVLRLAGAGEWPGGAALSKVPWWGWTGGLLGVSYVMSMLLFADRLGSAVFTGVVVAAALITSIALDHFGLVGFKVHPINIWRVVGALMMLGGLGFIRAF